MQILHSNKLPYLLNYWSDLHRGSQVSVDMIQTDCHRSVEHAVSLYTCLDTNWLTFGHYNWCLPQLTCTYSSKNCKGSQVSEYDIHWECHMLNVFCGLDQLFRVTGWDLVKYSIVTSNDLLTALKVRMGLKFHWRWLNWDCCMWSMLGVLEHMFCGHWMRLGHNIWYWPQMIYIQPWK